MTRLEPQWLSLLSRGELSRFRIAEAVAPYLKWSDDDIWSYVYSYSRLRDFVREHEPPRDRLYRLLNMQRTGDEVI